MSAGVRVGQGVDAHRFSQDPGHALVLGGVTIPEGPGLEGHSDADVVLHALTDALLGAGGLGDLGSRFGQADPAYADADSRLFVGAALELLSGAGWAVGNADVTVIAQRPRLAPFLAGMRASLTELLGAEVNVKATSTDGLGFAGRGEGIACLAVVLLVPTSAA